MEGSKISGAKHGVQTMLYYYLSSLIGTTPDPKQVIATELGAMIDLSEEQIQYVKMSIAHDNKMLENLSSCVALLSNIEKTGELDLQSIGIVRKILEVMQSQCKIALDEYIDFTEED